MKHLTTQPGTRTGPATLAWLLLWGLFGALPFAAAQPDTVTDPVIPPGFVLVGDEVLPASALGRNGNFTNTAWTNSIVPYTFNANVTAANQTLLRNAMAELEGISNITFVPRTNQANSIAFNASNRNTSQVGMQGGSQTINIVSWNTKYIIVHEMMHALGSRHEQSRPDRNNFVTINFANIGNFCGAAGNVSCANNFNIDATATTVGAYDFLSIMHYGGNAFTNGGGPTITCNPGFQLFQNQLGQRTYMTFLDAGGVAARYGAAPSPTITNIGPTSAPEGSGAVLVTIDGTRFYTGSPNALGVQGTRVLWNGNPLPTTYVNPTQLTVLVPANLLASAGCGQIQIENQFPGGGLSNSMPFAIDPAGGTPGSFIGTGPNAGMGRSVAGLGDVDGDGQADVLVGEPQNGEGRGRAWCFSGADGTVLWTLEGPNTTYELGYCVANAGDVNNDGVDDAAIGAPGYNADAGLVRLVDGASGLVIRTLYGTSLGGVTGDRFGQAVAPAGDVNDDGVSDVVVGAPLHDSNRGRALIVDGSNANALFTFTGDNAGDQFGYAVAGGFDLGGNGQPDVVVGAPFADTNGNNAGRVRAFSGQTGVAMTAKDGDAQYDNFGVSLAVAPSIDGRPGGCFIVGAPESGSVLGPAPGNGYVRVFGPFAAGTYPTLMSLVGTAIGSEFGRSVADAGDYDQDGVTDILVGVPAFTAFVGPGIAAARIYSGRTDALLLEETGDPADGFARAVAGVGDTNGNGMNDVLVGSPTASSPSCAAGGRADILSVPFPPSLRKPMLTEVTWGDPDGVEITNFDTVAADLTGWRVLWNDGTERVSTPLALALGPGASMVVQEANASGGSPFSEIPATGVDVVNGWTSLPTTSQAITVSLVDANGLVVDEVRVADAQGNHGVTGPGGLFRGLALRRPGNPNFGAVERIWGLDSNSGGDWTSQAQTSMGLESRSSGSRGSDPIPVQAVLINEIDDDPDFIEFRNLDGADVELRNWKVAMSANQNLPHVSMRPWPASSIVPNWGFRVIGDSANPPAELPQYVPYLQTSSLVNIPFYTEEYSCALYDAYGRLVDLVRTTGHNDQVAHNHPRAPGDWAAFMGAAGRDGSGEGSIGRHIFSDDNNLGSDFRSLATRSMGMQNLVNTYGPTVGADDAWDVRLNGTGPGGGLTVIINAGPQYAGYRFRFTLSPGHLQGTGPFFGLGADAAQNLAILNQAPWAGLLDAEGSARIDLPPLSIPGFQSDTLWLLQAPNGALTFTSRLLEFDS
jgi:hypothetical protein